MGVRRIEDLVDAFGHVDVLEPLLPCGGRRRVLSLRTLLVGIGLAAAGNSALYLLRVHQVLPPEVAPGHGESRASAETLRKIVDGSSSA